MVKLMMVCEDESDFRVAAGLLERVVAEKGPEWLRSMLEGATGLALTWQKEDGHRPFFDLHRIVETCTAQGVRLPQGHFDGSAGRSGAQSARNAFALARHLNKNKALIDAVLFVWDMDQDAYERRAGLEQARREASIRFSTTFQIVLGCPNAMMEAWLLAGFRASNDDEQKQIRDERTKVGFSPVEQSHKLDATSNRRGASAKRDEPLSPKSAKRVLAALTGGEHDRIEKCWKETPLDVLRDRGEHNGLREYLKEVAEILVPLFAR